MIKVPSTLATCRTEPRAIAKVPHVNDALSPLSKKITKSIGTAGTPNVLNVLVKKADHTTLLVAPSVMFKSQATSELAACNIAVPEIL